MPLWNSNYITQLEEDALLYITNRVNTVYYRFLLAITAGQSVYTLPSYVRSIRRITCKGKKLDAESFEYISLLDPQSIIVSESTKIEAVRAEPRMYSLHPNNYRNIRFYPTPGVDFDATGDPNGAEIDTKVVVSCWRNVDSSAAVTNIPPEIANKLIEAYKWWKAFAIEGSTQNIKASDYWKNKLDILMQMFKDINNKIFMVKKRQLQGGYLTRDPLAPPVLPAGYRFILPDTVRGDFDSSDFDSEDFG